MKTFAVDWFVSGATASAMGVLLTGADLRGGATTASSALVNQRAQGVQAICHMDKISRCGSIHVKLCIAAKPTISRPSWVQKAWIGFNSIELRCSISNCGCKRNTPRRRQQVALALIAKRAVTRYDTPV
jgi:hypothetical protein